MHHHGFQPHLVVGVLDILLVGPTCAVILRFLGGGFRSTFQNIDSKCIEESPHCHVSLEDDRLSKE